MSLPESDLFIGSQQAWLLCPPVNSDLLENNGPAIILFIIIITVFALTMYHEHCFLVTITLSHSASLRLLHQAPGQLPSGLLQMWNVHQGRLATVFLFLLPLQDKGPYFPHIWLSFFFWVSGDVIKKCQW